MKLHSAFLPLAIALTLSGCVVEPTTPAPDRPMCNARQYNVLVGQPASVLRNMRFDGPVRVIRPGMAVTQDYRGDRINFDVNRRNVIKSAYCG